MNRTHTISPEEALLVAMARLDQILLHILSAGARRSAAAFLNWVAEEETITVEVQLKRNFYKAGFAATVRRVDHRIALAQWVKHWVCPKIASRFELLGPWLPPFSLISPAALHRLESMSAAESRATSMTHRSDDELYLAD